MSEIKKNKKTGSEYLLIGKKKFNSVKYGVFEMDLEDVENILIDELPIDRECRVYKNRFANVVPSSPNIEDWPIEKILILEHKNTGSFEIFFKDEGYNDLWSMDFTPAYFFELKHQILMSQGSLNPKIIDYSVNSSGEVIFNFSISLTAKTIGELFEHAVEIDYAIEYRIAEVIEKTKSFVQIILGRGFQIKLPPNVYPGVKKDNNSTV